MNLYVQAHSKVVLILLAEEGLNTDCKAIKALVRLGATCWRNVDIFEM